MKEQLLQTADKVAKELVEFTRQANVNEEYFLDLIEEQIFPVEQFFANYSCAIMEVETKFKVLNEQAQTVEKTNKLNSELAVKEMFT